jgi:AraC-like DNA-binding protein
MRAASINASALADWRQFLSDADERARRQFYAFSSNFDETAVSACEHVDLGEFVSTLERVGRSSEDPGISWRAGQRAQCSVDGPVGKAVLSSKVLGAGLFRLCELYHLLQESTLFKVEVDEQWAILSYKILDPDIWPRHEDAMYTLGIFGQLIKTTAPGAWSDVELSFEAEEQTIGSEISGIVQAKVCYGACANSIRFPASALNFPLSLKAPEPTGLVRDLVRCASERRQATALVTRVEQAVLAAMENGAVSAETIAQELGFSERSLRRQLAEEGAAFREIVEDCRMRCAAHYLRHTQSLSLSEIAFRIGYSDQSNFTRAFSRWAGVAPNAFRRLVASDASISH